MEGNILNISHIEKNFVDVKPSIPIVLFDAIKQVSLHTDKPIKYIAEHLCIYILKQSETLHVLKEDLQKRSEKGSFVRRSQGRKRRLSIQFNSENYQKVCIFAQSFNLSLSSATYILLYTAMKDQDVRKQFIQVNYN